MGQINLLAVVLGALAFFAIGALWYGPLFGKPWKAASAGLAGTCLIPPRSVRCG
jgi:hypothetical protein